MRYVKMRNGLVVIIGLLLILSSGCGSSGNTHSATTIPTDIVTTPEFYRSNGLAQVHADQAYVRNGTGQGIIVGVVDSGVDPTHPDLDDNISPDSINVADNSPISDPQGHGTFVSGIIAAEKNDTGIHGIAYEATLLVAGTQSGREQLAIGLDYVREHGAQVVNISAGGEGGFGDELEQALIRAADAGVMVFFPTGNDGGTYSTEVATFINSEAANNLILSVGAVDADNNAAVFNNACGVDNLMCLVAPGVDIESTFVASTTVASTTVGSGTSYSAPFVTGAAAVLLQLFPALTPQQVIQLLLETATDLGDPGVDAIYGHGLLNLTNAVSPQGALSVPLNASASLRAPLTTTRLALGSAFGDALSTNARLQAAVFVDAYNRAYDVDLAARIQPAIATIDLHLAPAAGTRQELELPTLAGLSTRFAFSTQAPVPGRDAPFNRFGAAVVDRVIAAADTAIALSFDLSENTAFGFGVNTSSRQLVGDQHPGTQPYRSWFLRNRSLLQPMQSLISSPLSLAIHHHWNDATHLSIGLMRGTGGEHTLGGRGWLTEATVEHVFEANALFGTTVGIAAEKDAFLNSVAAGAYGVNSATTHYIKLFGSVPLTTTTTAFANTTVGVSRIHAHPSTLLDDWSRVRTSAFGIGVVSTDLWAVDDRLRLMFGSPLRVNYANATLIVPSAQNTDGSIVFDSQRIDLSPSGRELDFQVAYSRGVGLDLNLCGWLLLQLQPGHHRSVQTNAAIGMRMDIRLGQ